jgi:c-di-GMP-binding flagellar brake protein YcgR
MVLASFVVNCKEAPLANTVPLLIMGRSPCTPEAHSTGAIYAFDKPISVEQAVRTLSAARNMILDGRLRYHRAGVEVPVTLSGRRQKRIGGQLVNLSQGGLQVRVNDGFDLPGTKFGMKADVEVAWSDDQGNVGVRFVKIEAQKQQTLRVWLAQQYFAN